MKNDDSRPALRLASVLWAAQIYFASSSPALQSDHTRSILVTILEAFFQFRPAPDTVKAISLLIRKTAHLVEFGVLSVLLFGAFGGTQGTGPDKNAARWALAIAALYAASDEFHQLFVNGRGASPFDWGIDVIGAICGLTFIRWLRSKRLHEYRRGAP